MFGIPKTESLRNSVISGVCHQGLSVAGRDGRPARLAVVDADGNIIDDGPAVAREVWNVTLAVYKSFLVGNGHLHIFSGPPNEVAKQQESVAA